MAPKPISSSVYTTRQSNGPKLEILIRYGFVQFKRKSAVNAALKTLQRRMLDGHSLELKRSTRATSDANQEVNKGSTEHNSVENGLTSQRCGANFQI